MKSTFGTVLNCIDGRTQIPVINWMKENFNVEYVDLITEPGMDKVLSQGSLNEISSLRYKVNISVEAHESTIIAVVGHYDCAANPVSEEEHYRDIEEAANVVKNWGLSVDVVLGIWLDKLWKVNVVELYMNI